jgi:hypothetical protein
LEDLETSQIDIKGAYLNGELTSDERIFMKQLPGFAEGKLVCKLCKTLYRLKQSGRCWYQKLVEIMMKLTFSRSEVDQAVFYRRDIGRNLLIIVLVHVDDYSIVATTQPLINAFKIEIKKQVEITNMGEFTGSWASRSNTFERKRKFYCHNAPTSIQFYADMLLMTSNLFRSPWI